MKNMDAHLIIELKNKLPHNSYRIISKMINGKYTPGTIRAMFRDDSFPSSRKMQQEVFDAANKFVELMNPESL